MDVLHVECFSCIMCVQDIPVSWQQADILTICHCHQLDMYDFKSMSLSAVEGSYILIIDELVCMCILL